MAAGSFILPLLPDIIDFEVNNAVEGQVNNTAPTGVVLLDTDLNQINPVSITQIANYFEIVIATGSIVPAIIEINGVAFKTVDPGDTLDILIENSDLVSVGTPDAPNNRVDIADSTLLIQKSDSTLIFSFDIAAEDLDFYNVADSAITVLNSLSNVVDSGNVKATESGNFTAPDGTYENSDSTFTDSVASGELNKLIPDIDLSVNSVVEGSVPSVKDIDIELEDSLSNPITPTSVTMVGDVLTIEVPLYTPPPTTGDYLVRFFDIDGTILKEEWVDAGNDATAPANPNYDPTYLTFAEWNQPFTNVQNDIDVGAIYDTIDGKTYLFVRITDTTGLQPTIRLNKTGTALLTVNWGDSTTNTSTTNGDFTLTKTAAYAAIGDYIITIESTDLHRVNSGGFLFGSNLTYSRCLLVAYLGNNFRMTTLRGFEAHSSLTYISINKQSTTLQGQDFWTCSSLKHCSLPANAQIIGQGTFQSNFSLVSVSIPITNTNYNGMFRSCFSLRKAIITGCTSLASNEPFTSNFALQEIVIPNAVTAISSLAFNSCRSLAKAKMTTGLIAITAQMMDSCSSLKEIEFGSSVTSIAAGAFNGCSSILEYTFLSTTPPTLAATNSFTGINAACKIYVPDANVAAYKAATNWSTYANYIYPLSTKP